MLGIEMMVRIVPNSVAMGVNAALLFIAAAVCLWPASWPRAFSRLPTLCAWLLILLPCAVRALARYQSRHRLDCIACDRQGR
jgi:hypothetical protein